MQKQVFMIFSHSAFWTQIGSAESCCLQARACKNGTRMKAPNDGSCVRKIRRESVKKRYPQQIASRRCQRLEGLLQYDSCVVEAPAEQIPPASSAKLFSKECFGVMFQVDFLARMRRKNEKIRILHLPLKLMA